MRGMRYQPQGGQSRLSALAISLGFTHAFNFGDGTVRPNNLVTGAPGISNAVNASLIGGPGGRAMQLTGALGDRLEVAGNPFSTSTCSYLWVDSGIDNTPNGQAVVQTRYAQSAAGEQYGLQIRVLGDSIHILSAQAVDRVAVAGRNNAGGINVSAVSVNGGYGRHAVFNQGRLLYGAVPSNTQFDPPYQHGLNVIGGAFDCTSSTVKYYALLFAPKVLPDEVLKFLTANPWVLFAAPHAEDEVAPLTLTPIAAALSMVGFTATISQARTLAPATASLTLTGYAPTITQPHTLAPAGAALTLTGNTPLVSQVMPQTITPAGTALTLAGGVPDVMQGAQAPVPSGGSGAGPVREVRRFADMLDRARKPTRSEKRKRREVLEAEALELLPDLPEAEKLAPIAARIVFEQEARALAPLYAERPIQALVPVVAPFDAHAALRDLVAQLVAEAALQHAQDADESDIELLLLGS